MKKSNVFIGPVDVANISMSFAIGLKSVGIKSTFYSYQQSSHEFGYKTEKVIPQYDWEFRLFGKKPIVLINLIVKYLFLMYVLLKHNTFIFISPHTLLRNHFDLKLLSFFNKKIIFLFVGCHERQLDFLNNNPEYICNRCTDTLKQKICLCDNLVIKKQRIQLFEKYSNYIVAQDDSAGYLKKISPIWFHLIMEEPIQKNYLSKHKNTKIRIVHFPSNSLIKLSHLIIPVMKEIETEFENIEIVIKSGIPHSEVIEELEQAHIVIDALGLSYGMLAIEAMARGCVVVVGEMDFINNRIPDLACIGATARNLKSKIIDLISDRNNLLKIAEKSITFYENHHTPVVGGNYYKEKLNL